jgi:hypothetical protein
MISEVEKTKRQRGVTLFGSVLGHRRGSALIARACCRPGEFFTIKRTVNKIASAGRPFPRSGRPSSGRTSYSIVSITGKDLTITKENDKVVVSFAYDKEVELVKPVFLLIKFEGRSN